MRNPRSVLTTVLIVGLATWSAALLAGVEVGHLKGTVRDETGAPLPGVAVSAKGAAGTRATATDGSGAYRLLGLPTGDYEVTASLSGFTSRRRTVAVRAGITSDLDFVLTVGSVAEQITVEPDASPSRPRHQPPVLAISSEPWRFPSAEFRTENFDKIDETGFVRADRNPLSTFSVDVDTASYSIVRRMLSSGRLPPPDAVRIEELLNYFRYDYPDPEGADPVSITTEVSGCPWNQAHRLVQIGLQARRPEQGKTPPRNLVFLLDVSGSMSPADRLPLVRSAMNLLVDQLTEKDSVAIVVYAGAAGLVLPPTRGDERGKIRQAIGQLEAGGSTNGGQGIELAYRIAQEGFIQGGVNRVILATDGDFNVGVSSRGDLVRLIEEKRKTGVFLSTLGVGADNFKDATLEQLADRGNGNYGYLDGLQEAHKILVREAGSTLITVAKDVKVQVEFNPARVSAYRLVGYENRALKAEDFKDDRKDAGEMGAGHAVTALYEIVPAGRKEGVPGVDPLRYQQAPKLSAAAGSGELLSVKVRYKLPQGEASTPLRVPVLDPGPAPHTVSANLGFSSAVAEFGLLLRGSEHKGQASWQQVLTLAREHRGRDPEGDRAQFVKLVELAEGLSKARPESR